ncbi:MAG: hypothetical protein Q9160_008363 [Pyrenula sp. 1 TL-2023]
MADRKCITPRVFLYRHGETEWTLIGRWTGTTDLALTENGVRQVMSSGKLVIGRGKLIDPSRVARVYISPRVRAMQTFEAAFGADDRKLLEDGDNITVTAKLAEWNYGAYEGLRTKEIRVLRKERGLDRDEEWNIWRDGCEEGESAQQVTERLDSLIQDIHTLQKDNLHGERPSDVVLISHGHLLRAFVKRWLRQPTDFPLSLILEPGGVGAVSYDHHSIEEPALLAGLGFPP